MNFLNRFKAAILVAVLAIFGLSVVTQRVVAQDPGFGDLVASSTISINPATPAVIITAVSGKSIIVKSMQLATITTGGIVTFYNGADATKPNFTNGNGLNAYVPTSTSVNNNVTVGKDVLPQQGPNAVMTTAGSALCAQLNGCTLVYTVRYALQ